MSHPCTSCCWRQHACHVKHAMQRRLKLLSSLGGRCGRHLGQLRIQLLGVGINSPPTYSGGCADIWLPDGVSFSCWRHAYSATSSRLQWPYGFCCICPCRPQRDCSSCRVSSFSNAWIYLLLCAAVVASCHFSALFFCSGKARLLVPVRSTILFRSVRPPALIVVSSPTAAGHDTCHARISASAVFPGASAAAFLLTAGCSHCRRRCRPTCQERSTFCIIRSRVANTRAWSTLCQQLANPILPQLPGCYRPMSVFI